MIENNTTLFNRVYREIRNNKERREQGKLIAIPFPFKRFSEYVPGIQKGRYIIVTANSKVGKSRITDYVFCYSPIEFILHNPNCGLDVKIDYFSLEMSKEDKMKQYIAYKLFVKYGILLSEEEIDSIYENYTLTDDVLRKIEELQPEIELFLSKINYIDTTKNPYGIYKHVRDYCESNGKYIAKNGKEIPLSALKSSDPELKRKALDSLSHYEPNNPDLIYEVVTDHLGLLTPEKKEGVKEDLRETIGNFSSNYCIKMRDRWKVTVINIQQQAASQEGVENIKLSLTKPSPNGLGINKNTQQDCDVIFGLYAPSRFNIKIYKNYNIATPNHPNEMLEDYMREFSVLLNRRGGGGGVSTPLLFIGQSTCFKELPRPENIEEMDKLNNFVKKLKATKRVCQENLS